MDPLDETFGMTGENYTIKPLSHSRVFPARGATTCASTQGPMANFATDPALYKEGAAQSEHLLVVFFDVGGLLDHFINSLNNFRVSAEGARPSSSFRSCCISS